MLTHIFALKHYDGQWSYVRGRLVPNLGTAPWDSFEEDFPPFVEFRKDLFYLTKSRTKGGWPIYVEKTKHGAPSPT